MQFDAIFASSDLIAMTAISVLQWRGLQVPTDVPVVGYDDIEAAAHFQPSLTTVSQSLENAGQLLVQSLLRAMNGEVVEPILMPTRLITRESSIRT